MVWPSRGRQSRSGCGMGIAVDIRPTPACLYATLTGDFEDDDAKRALARIIESARPQRIPRILIDCRALYGDLSLSQRFGIASFALQLRINAILAGRSPVPFRTAIVAVPPLAHPNAHFVRFLNERNVSISLHGTMDEALAWLGLDPAPAAAPGTEKHELTG
jgi:hypothetical protein